MRIPLQYTLTLFALAMLASAALADDAQPPQRTVKNGISVQLPRDWKCQPRDSAVILLSAVAPAADTDTTGDYSPGLTITIAAGSTIDGAAQQDRLSRDIANYHVTEKPTTVHIHDMDAVTFGGTFTAGSLKLRTRQYLLSNGGHIYTLTITSLASAWEQHIAATEASVMSFVLEKK